MIKSTSVCSPNPYQCERQPKPAIFRNQIKISFLLTLIVLCLGLSAPSTAAQTEAQRQRSVGNQQPAVEQEQRASEASQRPGNTNRRGNAGGPATDPAVKKTVMIYTPPATSGGAPRPALVDDIIIISRAEDAPAQTNGSMVRPTAMVRGMAASANRPSIWPVTGVMTSNFGTRGNPFGGMSSEFHKGQDIGAPIGTSVIATADGIVVIAGWQRGYGRVVYLDHGNGITTRYGHLSRIDVAVGQTLKRGEQLGLVGSTGRSTGPHLHYEVRVNGSAANPLDYLPSLAPTSIAPIAAPALPQGEVAMPQNK